MTQVSPPPGDHRGLTWMPALLRVCSSRRWRERLWLTSRRRTNERLGDSPARAGWWGRASRDLFEPPGWEPPPEGRGASVWAVGIVGPVVSPALLFVRHAGESHFL